MVKNFIQYKGGLLKYNTTGAVPYTAGGFVELMDNCNGYIAINTGNDPVRIADTLLYPGIPGTINGEGKVVGGNFGEVFTGSVRIAFSGIGAAPQVTIEQKFYVIEDDKKEVR